GFVLCRFSDSAKSVSSPASSTGPGANRTTPRRVLRGKPARGEHRDRRAQRRGASSTATVPTKRPQPGGGSRARPRIGERDTSVSQQAQQGIALAGREPFGEAGLMPFGEAFSD